MAQLTDNNRVGVMSQAILSDLMRGAAEVIHPGELADRLAENRPLRVKLGFDPTAPDIHLGHTVILNKLAQFQALGHDVIFLIGDFTAMIGDPTGKNETRPALSQEEVLANAATYQAQAFKLLDPEKTTVCFNASWMDALSPAEIIRLMSTQTVARTLERDDFEKRYRGGQPIGLHEFMYPLMQAYDSVMLKADVELGGTDQKFNLLAGRDLQRHHGQSPQSVLMMPLLEGLDGVKKMSKSLGNTIGVTDAPEEMFGKVMSISDTLMWRYFELLSSRSTQEIAALQEAAAQGENPRDIKVALALELVRRFHDAASAEQARVDFIARFQAHALPEDLVEQVIALDSLEVSVAYLLKEAGLVSSTSEGSRMLKQQAVRIDGERLESPRITLTRENSYIVQVGRRRCAKVRIALSEG